MEPITSTRAVVLASVPQGAPSADDFTLTTRPLAEPGQDQVLLRVLDLSLDPFIRSTLGGTHQGDRSVGVGDVVGGRAVAEVVSSPGGSPAVGALVLAETGWVEHAVVDAAATTPVSVPDGVPSSAALGALGMPGLTAYAAVVRHARPQTGETVVVASATGGVGSLAGQLVAARGARAVAVVSTEEKATLATEELGYAAAVLRTSPTFADDLRAVRPDRIHGYLHMGDQATLDAVMAARAEVHGMVVYDHHDLAGNHVAEVGAGLAANEIAMPEDRTVGLERAGAAFAAMMSGSNVGKVVVEVARR